MFTVCMLAAPDRADLVDDRVTALKSRWDGGHALWLSHGVAAEFTVAALPADLEQMWEEWQEDGLDLAIVPTAGRRKSVLLADMDSTMIEQECLDELADVAGFGEPVAAITARAMNGELDFDAALVARVALLEGLADSVIPEVLASRITLARGGRTLVATMRAQGAWTALVSGGFTDFTGPVADLLGFDEQRANVLLAENGKLTGRVALPILGREAKVEALEAIVDNRPEGPRRF